MEIATIVVVVLVISTALIFDFTNGFHDTANAMATSIATGALKPKTAVIAAGTLNLVGAVIVGAGVQGVNFLAVLTKVLIPALISPVIAGLASFIAVKLIYLVVRKLDEKYVEDGFRHGQTITACLVALSHGTNDAQKTMGIITLTLIAVGAQASGTGPQLWVVFICGFAIALGTYTGGWRVIRTLGKGLTEINTPQGFAAEASSAATITRLLASGLCAFHDPGVLGLESSAPASASAATR